jgi:sulfur carrier protein
MRLQNLSLLKDSSRGDELQEPYIIVNGVKHKFRGETLHDLIVALGLEPNRQGIAVAVNGEVVSRSEWRELRLKPNDVIDIVTAVAGG